MYRIREEDIDFISADIRRRGIQLDSLQDALLDHICCVIENEYDGQMEFAAFYSTLLPRFYKEELREIEEETYLLLTFKNQEKMKTMTNLSGVLSALALASGIVFKYLHWPGAAAFIFIGIFVAALFFLPLQFYMRSKSSTSLRETLSLGSGTLLAMLLSLHILFRVFHWPGAAVLFYASLSLALIFIPVYFFTGYRKESLRQQTVLSTLLMLLGCGLIFTLMRTPRASQMLTEHQHFFFTNAEKKMSPSPAIKSEAVVSDLHASCEELRSLMLKQQPVELINGIPYRKEVTVENLLEAAPELDKEIQQLATDLAAYNAKYAGTDYKIKESPNFTEMLKKGTVFSALAVVNQIQLLLYQNPHTGRLSPV